MGGSSSTASEELQNWIIDESFTGVNPSSRHLESNEVSVIDFTILRAMETSRRIETKILLMGLENPDLLDVFDY